MAKYIALLRGINVGGNSKVPMPVLKQLFLQHGFSEVVTYINSGNVIFTSEGKDEAALKQECENFIEEHFKFRVIVAILTAGDLAAALAHAPSWWNADENSKHNAIFVIPPVTVEDIYRQIGVIKPEYEKIDYYGNVIFWSAPVETYSRTRLSKVVGSSVYDSITIRNANTTCKLNEMAKG